MSKGAARNMQRISLKVTAGTAPPQNPDVKQAPVYKQVRALELRRLARIRHTFEIEQEIADKQAAGESVGLLRERLIGVRNGTIEPPHYGHVRPTGDTLRLSKAQRPSSTRTPHQNEKPSREHRVYRSEREVQADLADLAKGKLTPTGIATVKGLLDRFDEDLVAVALGIGTDFIHKVAASAVFRLVPALSPKDGLLLASVLEKRLPPEEGGKAETRHTKATPVAMPSAVEAVLKPISVDAVTGAEYMDLRGQGWSISGAWLYPPGHTATATTPSREATKKAEEPKPRKRLRVAVAPPSKAPAKKSRKGKKVAQAKATEPRHVSLPPESLARLRANKAFQAQPTAAPQKPGTVVLPKPARAAFVAPPASTKINWADASEDGSMWDR
jgi:hypothetical protein